jgi:hypothetical protein
MGRRREGGIADRVRKPNREDTRRQSYIPRRLGRDDLVSNRLARRDRVDHRGLALRF